MSFDFCKGILSVFNAARFLQSTSLDFNLLDLKSPFIRILVSRFKSCPFLFIRYVFINSQHNEDGFAGYFE